MMLSLLSSLEEFVYLSVRPSSSYKNAFSMLIRLKFPAARQASWEHPFVRLIHLLARHPDFRAEEHEVAEIVMMSK